MKKTSSDEDKWHNWEASRNLSQLAEGNFRSIIGYAGESLVIGRALVCGYNLFFKAWRDSKYDAVLDSDGTLFRIEIKQTSKGDEISTTSGSRSGAQISRSADDRTQVLSADESDFLIGVHSLSGKCWIIPTEVIEIRNKRAIPTNQLTDFAEKWRIFKSPPFNLSINQMKNGFRNYNLKDLKDIATKLGIDLKMETTNYKFSERGKLSKLKSIEEWYVLEIWRTIFLNV